MPGAKNTIWKPVYKSELKLNSNNRSVTEFIWNQYSVMIADVCGSDLDQEVKMEFFKS